MIRGPDGRLRLKGGGAGERGAAGEQREPERSVDGRLRSRAAERRRRVGRSAVEPLRRRVRPLLDQRHAGAHERGTDEWTVKPGNLVPGFGKGFGFVDRFEPRLSMSGPLKRGRLLFGEYLQYRFVRTPVKSLPDHPQLGLEKPRLVHAA